MFKDETEKRQPIFTDNGSNLFLYHTTGDSWGLLSGHTGEQQIGIFKIDSSNSLIEHKIISDKEGIEDRIIVGLDTVFYRLITGNEYDKMPIKKVALCDLKNIN